MDKIYMQGISSCLRNLADNIDYAIDNKNGLDDCIDAVVDAKILLDGACGKIGWKKINDKMIIRYRKLIEKHMGKGRCGKNLN